MKQNRRKVGRVESMRPPTLVHSNGQLVDDYLPAIYFDSAMMVDYRLAWVGDYDHILNEKRSLGGLSLEGSQMRQTVSDRREITLEGMLNIRQRLLRGDCKAHPVSSMLTSLEVGEFVSRQKVRELLTEAFSAEFLIKRDNSRIIGDYVSHIFERFHWRKLDLGENTRKLIKDLRTQIEEAERILEKVQQTKNRKQSAGLKKRIEEVKKRIEELSRHRKVEREWEWCDYVFDEKLPRSIVYGLAGIYDGIPIAPILNFDLHYAECDSPLQLMAALQVGAADILHVLFAAHLGCAYFASLDCDFRRIRELIHELGLELLVSPQEVLTKL